MKKIHKLVPYSSYLLLLFLFLFLFPFLLDENENGRIKKKTQSKNGPQALKIFELKKN